MVPTRTNSSVPQSASVTTGKKGTSRSSSRGLPSARSVKVAMGRELNTATLAATVKATARSASRSMPSRPRAA